MSGAATHATVARALQVLDALEHRGASGAEIDTGDGAGILLQLPDAFLRAAVDFELPPSGSYAVGMCFLPKDPVRRRELEALIERTAQAEELELLGWRDVPVDSDVPGPSAAVSQSITTIFGPGVPLRSMMFWPKNCP